MFLQIPPLHPYIVADHDLQPGIKQGGGLHPDITTDEPKAPEIKISSGLYPIIQESTFEN
jgi:hypothetical protein